MFRSSAAGADEVRRHGDHGDGRGPELGQRSQRQRGLLHGQEPQILYKVIKNIYASVQQI